MDILITLDKLIDGWCERRALRPLKFLLPIYPGVLVHTDQKFELLNAIKDMKGLCCDDLTAEERILVSQVHNALEDALHRSAA